MINKSNDENDLNGELLNDFNVETLNTLLEEPNDAFPNDIENAPLNEECKKTT